MKTLSLTIGIIFFSFSYSISQNKQIDSLLLVLKTSKPDTSKVNTLYQLGVLYERNNKDELLKTAEKILSLSQSLNYKKGMAMADLLFSKHYKNSEKLDSAFYKAFASVQLLNQINAKPELATCLRYIARLYMMKGNNDFALHYLDSSAVIWHQAGIEKEEAKVYAEIGGLYTDINNYASGLESLERALQIFENIHERQEVANVLSWIAVIYLANDEDSLAENYISESSEIFKQIRNSSGLAVNNITIGDLFMKKGDLSTALSKYRESLKIFEQTGAANTTIGWGYMNIGRAYSSLGDSLKAKFDIKTASINYEKALENFLFAIKMVSELPSAVGENYLYMGFIYFEQEKFSLSKKFFMQGIERQNSGPKRLIARAYLQLSKIDSIQDNKSLAYEHFKLYNFYHESDVNTESIKKLEFHKAQTRIKQKEKEIELLSSENKLKTAIGDKRNQQKKFAYAAIALVLLFGGYGFYRYRSSKKMEMMQAKMKDRLNISQGLHDDLGSTLSSISIYCQVAKTYSEQDQKVELNEMLGKISTTSNEMVSEMNDIVWAINPKNDSMERIIQRMESFAKPMLTTRKIIFNLNYKPTILLASLDMEKRKNIYLIFKEAVNNAFKYSGCTEINTTITNSNKHLELTIKDNGVGFDVQSEIAGDKLTLSGNGLRNMKSRAEEMKGELLVNSFLGEGTEIRLNFPIP